MDGRLVSTIKRTDANAQQRKASRLGGEGANVTGTPQVRMRPHEIGAHPSGEGTRWGWRWQPLGFIEPLKMQGWKTAIGALAWKQPWGVPGRQPGSVRFQGHDPPLRLQFAQD